MGRTVVGKKRPKKVIFPMDVIRDRKYRRPGPVRKYVIPEGGVTSMETSRFSTINTWQDLLNQPKEVRRAFLLEHNHFKAKELAELLGTTVNALNTMRSHLGISKPRQQHAKQPRPATAVSAVYDPQMVTLDATVPDSVPLAEWLKRCGALLEGVLVSDAAGAAKGFSVRLTISRSVPSV